MHLSNPPLSFTGSRFVLNLVNSYVISGVNSTDSKQTWANLKSN